MSNPSTQHAPTPAPPAIKPVDLATYRETADGNIVLKLERYGRITIELAGTGQYLEVFLTRPKGEPKNFHAYVATGVAGNAEVTLAAKRANNGIEPGALHLLYPDGVLYKLDEPMSRKERMALTGRDAAAAGTAEFQSADTLSEPTISSHAETIISNNQDDANATDAKLELESTTA